MEITPPTLCQPIDPQLAVPLHNTQKRPLLIPGAASEASPSRMIISLQQSS
jgi:hypothetical protein